MSDLFNLYVEAGSPYGDDQPQSAQRWAADQLTTAQAENEALRARLADAINCLDTVSGKAELGASVVRAERTEAMNHVAEGFDVIKRYAKTEAQRLRQQADEAERVRGEQ